MGEGGCGRFFLHRLAIHIISSHARDSVVEDPIFSPGIELVLA